MKESGETGTELEGKTNINKEVRGMEWGKNEIGEIEKKTSCFKLV